MAHEVESMLYVGETPWHGLGVKLERAPTSREAIVASGLDWEVAKEPLVFASDGTPTESWANIRVSDRKILGYTGPDWEPLQNAHAFEWFDPFLASGEATIETAGALRGGEVVWILARIGRDDSVIVPRSDDRVAKFILLAHGHNGKMSVRAGFSPIRVVCANTLAMAYADDASKLLRLRHTKGTRAALDDVRDVMNTANATFEATAEQYRRLARREINAETLERYVARVFEAPPVSLAPAIDDIMPARFLGNAKPSRAERNARARLETISELFEHGRGNDLPGVRGTAWAAYNAVTEYLTHERPGMTSEARIDSLTFRSDGVKLADRALAQALAIAA